MLSEPLNIPNMQVFSAWVWGWSAPAYIDGLHRTIIACLPCGQVFMRALLLLAVAARAEAKCGAGEACNMTATDDSLKPGDACATNQPYNCTLFQHGNDLDCDLTTSLGYDLGCCGCAFAGGCMMGENGQDCPCC